MEGIMDNPRIKNINENVLDYESRIFYRDEVSDRIKQMGAIVEYDKDHVLIEADEVPDYCYFVVSGRVISYEYSSMGKMRVYHLFEDNSIFAEDHLLFQTPSQLNFMTGEKTKLRCISRKMLLDAIYESPDVCLNLMESLTVKFESTLQHLRYLKMHNIPWKVCDLFLSYADRYGVEYDGKIMINDRITQQRMSDFLGTNRISIVNAVAELKEKRLIEQVNGHYVIRDIDALTKYRDSMLE